MANWGLGLLDPGTGRPEQALDILHRLVSNPPGGGRHHAVAIWSVPDLVEAAVRAGRPLVVVEDRDEPDFVHIAERIASEIDGARLEVVRHVDHIVPVRAGQAFTELLAGFLDNLHRSQWRRTR